MKLEHPFLQLPVSFDAGVLAREIEALGPDVWRPHPQGFAGNDALTLISVDGDPASDDVHGPMRPTPHLLACPYLMQVMHSLGAVWGRSRLMRLAGQAEVTPHVDINYYWREHMRIHVPIVTQPTVRFVCDGQELNMREGECWTFDTWRRHNVHNDDHRQRIHLVADTVGGPGFWELMRDARPHDEQREGWTPRLVAPRPEPVALQLESYNLPTVMTPWEARTHFEFLVGEAASSESLDRFVRDAMQPFLREWQALWALHGDSGRGLDAYRAARDRMRMAATPFDTIRMRNNVLLTKALHAIVTMNLVAASTRAAAPVAAAARPQAQAPRAAAPAATRSIGGNFNPMFQFGPTSTPRPAASAGAVAVAPRPTAPAPPAPAARSNIRFDRPVIVLSAPRSGSTLLFETLARAPDVYTIGRESHRTFESLPGLKPADRGFDSNRLTGDDATPAVIEALKANFAAEMRDRDGVPPRHDVVRLLEKTPKNSLRVPFLRRAFPDAHYVLLYRRPNEVLASMIEAWQSGKFRTYPTLPGWNGLPWSMLLVPGWRSLDGKPIEEIAAYQWACTMNTLLDDVADLPRDRVTTVRYHEFLANPQAEMQRVTASAGLGWDVVLDALPLSKTTLTKPDPDKWRKHEAAISRVLPGLQSTIERAERYFGSEPSA
ncbi:sulfotransferase [Lysobacter claricitrinus]|uniref:sulfotransferase n=1 Tax=Lysobacter claricitrinus TaxID=3367728 RepID=UPI0037DBD33B